MKAIRNLTVVIGISALSGCAAIGGLGESSYSCSGLPEKQECMSARDAYEMTSNGGSIYDRDYNKTDVQGVRVERGEIREGRGFQSKEDRLSGGRNVGSTPQPATGDSEERIYRKIEDRYVAPSVPSKPVPVRTPAKVMRVWIAPWEDKNENLRVSSYVFTEIEQRKWMYDMRGVARGEAIQPLQMMKQASEEGGHRRNQSQQGGGNGEGVSFEGALPEQFRGNQ